MSSLRCEQLLASCCILLLLGPAHCVDPPRWTPNPGQVSSVGCSAGQECVPYDLCQAGVIITDDAGVFNPKAKIPSSRQCESQKYPGEITICCGIPGWNPPSTIAPSKGCSAEQECVTNYQCQAGVIITDGAGLINPKAKIPSSRTCTLTDQGPHLSGVCCNTPVVHNPSTIYNAAPVCGFSNADTGSQVADNEAWFGQFPWQAAIRNLRNSSKICGASIIGDRWLLTAAHCVYGFYATDIKIRVGEWQDNSLSEPLPFIDVDLKNITIHNEFNNNSLHNDIAVLELTKPLTMQYHINSICLPSSGQSFWGQRCISTGWGKDIFGGSYQNILKKVELPLVDDEQCQTQLRNTKVGSYFILDDSFICAGGEANKYSCTGDGGGPLACLGADGRYFLTGITAWGIECGKKDAPGVYVDVAAFTSWILNIIYGNQLG